MIHLDFAFCSLLCVKHSWRFHVVILQLENRQMLFGDFKGKKLDGVISVP